MVASRCSTNFGPLLAGAEVNGVAVIVGMVRLMSRSTLVEALPKFVTLELMPEMGLVFSVALTLTTVEDVEGDSAGGVTTNEMLVAPAATESVFRLHVIVLPACETPPGHAPDANPVKVAPAGTFTVSTVFVESDGPEFNTVKS
jgi:hypothetical protein